MVEEKEEAEVVKEEEEEEVEVDVDMNAMVARLEAKCANVREELGRMAVSEQYMRTKQAQLVMIQLIYLQIFSVVELQ